MSKIANFPFDMKSSYDIRYNPIFHNYTANHSMNDVNGLSYFNLKVGMMNCDDCEALKSDHVLSFENMNAPIMIIGETPNDVLFETDKGKFLGFTLSEIGLSFENIYRTSLYKNDKPEKKICSDHITSEIITVNPVLILALGYEVGFHLFKGDLYPSHVSTLSNGSQMLTTYSVEEVVDDESKFNDWRNHLIMLKKQFDYLSLERSQ